MLFWMLGFRGFYVVDEHSVLAQCDQGGAACVVAYSGRIAACIICCSVTCGNIFVLP